MTRPVMVDAVSGRRDRRRFLRLPWRIYEDDPAWVPPLLHERRKLLDRSAHPFHAHADVDYLLARRGSDIVGRTAAIVNHRHNEFHDERAAAFGLFEAADEPVARALLEVAERWARRRGMERLRGPMNFSSNEEWGLLVEGFERPPAIMMTHHPPAYAGWLEAAGYRKARDLLAYELVHDEPPERLERGVERILRKTGAVVRSLDPGRFEEEVATVKRLYNSSWERNWGFVPMTDAEFEWLADDLRPVVEPELCPVAEVDGEPVGFALALPDYNQAIRHANGRLFPFGLLKILWHRRNIDRVRILTLGLVPEYRRSGLDAALYLHLFREGLEAGYHRAECSWVLEDNWAMRRGLERMGGEIYKRYRIYEKDLAPS